MLKITTMAQTLSKEDIEEVILNRDGSVKIQAIDELYYPYMQMIYSVKISKKFTKMDRLIMCNIDLMYGSPAVGQGQPDFVEKDIDETLALEPMLEESRLEKIGHDYVMKVFLGKMKILQTPNIELERRQLFHKLFYIVHCKDATENEEDYFLMVDSMDGSLSVIDS